MLEKLLRRKFSGKNTTKRTKKNNNKKSNSREGEGISFQKPVGCNFSIKAVQPLSGKVQEGQRREERKHSIYSCQKEVY